MDAPDKIYLDIIEDDDIHMIAPSFEDNGGFEYIRKDALLEWLQKELERLWEIIPDADNENPTQMELRYLGEYMATERLIDHINEM